MEQTNTVNAAQTQAEKAGELLHSWYSDSVQSLFTLEHEIIQIRDSVMSANGAFVSLNPVAAMAAQFLASLDNIRILAGRNLIHAAYIIDGYVDVHPEERAKRAQELISAYVSLLEHAADMTTAFIGFLEDADTSELSPSEDYSLTLASIQERISCMLDKTYNLATPQYGDCEDSTASNA